MEEKRVKVKRDLTGGRFGRLVVLEQADDYVAGNGKRFARWLCQCDCDVQSCGCLNREITSLRCKGVPITHGGTHERLYGIWVNMRRRCRAENRADYRRYGWRNITVCEEWDTDYQQFKDWALENGYDPDADFGACTIDRINVNGPYCPENCRWVAMREQAHNKTTNRKYTYLGETKTMAEWADEYGFNRETLWRRLIRYGLPIEQALTIPLSKDGSTLKEAMKHGT